MVPRAAGAVAGSARRAAAGGAGSGPVAAGASDSTLPVAVNTVGSAVDSTLPVVFAGGASSAAVAAAGGVAGLMSGAGDTGAASSAAPPAVPVLESAVLPTAEHPWAMRQRADPVKAYQENTSAIITAVTSNFELLIDGLPVGPVLHDALTGMLWTIRRSLFNLAPTMDQSYSVTAGLGTVTGKATATDPEGDRIQYMVVQGPAHGSLTLNVDGGYVYTPGAGFEGVDTFVIAANDLGWHINLLEPFGVAGASASMLVNQNAIDFSFDYNDPDGYFTDQARQALYKSAKRLSAYFLVDHPTVLTYKVNSVNTDGGFLAMGVSRLINQDDPGFWPTIVQEKLLTGVDANGEEADGRINWNWHYNWGFYPTVEYDQYDVTTVIMHELLHSFGFESAAVRGPSPGGDLGDTDREVQGLEKLLEDAGIKLSALASNTNWSIYDKFTTTIDGNSPIDPGTYLWNSAYDPYLVGYGGGMFFTGANAMAAYAGRPVPLYTPNTWEPGSSILHLDDGIFSGPNRALMDHAQPKGPVDIVLKPVELGVLMDLGYTVVPSPWFAYPP